MQVEPPTGNHPAPDNVTEWLGGGPQNLRQRFDSVHCLYRLVMELVYMLVLETSGLLAMWVRLPPSLLKVSKESKRRMGSQGALADTSPAHFLMLGLCLGLDTGLRETAKAVGSIRMFPQHRFGIFHIYATLLLRGRRKCRSSYTTTSPSKLRPPLFDNSILHVKLLFEVEGTNSNR